MTDAPETPHDSGRYTRPRDAERAERDRRERLAEIGTIASSLVHEIRNPLHAILLTIQVLAEDGERLPPEWRARFAKRLRRVETEIASLAEMLETFLSFARPPRMNVAPVDLNRFLRETLEFMDAELRRADVRVDAELAEDMYPVVLDPIQFGHVVLNLAKNAAEAIEERRESEAEDFEGVIRIRTEEDDAWITLSVEDNGAGIPPGEEERIFDLFYTTKAKGNGLGLGLVRRIVEEHRGFIAAAPGLARGARFVITLPRGRFLEFRADEEETPPPA